MHADGHSAAKAKSAKQADLDLVNDLRLEAARRRLAEASDKEDALEAVREIVGNLLGCEEMGLFQVDSGVRMLWSFGIDPHQHNAFSNLGDEGLHRVMRGECHFESTSDDGNGSVCRMQAFVPLRRASQTVAVLAILKLLPQKQGFDRPDMNLLALLSEEAGKALFGSA
jgi:hypothetical protein